MNDEEDWDGVTDRREGERREKGPPQHVRVDGLDNGAHTLVLSAIDEAKKTRRWIVGAILSGAAVVFFAGEFRANTIQELDRRPTESAVVQMLDSLRIANQAKEEALGEALDNNTRTLDVLVTRSNDVLKRVEALENIHIN